MALLESVLDQLLHHLRMERVEDVEEELSVTLPSLGVRVREELSHSLNLDDLVIE